MEKIEDVVEEPSLKLTANDRKIIKELYDNARTPVSVIAKKVLMSKEGINYRINRLLKTGLLTGFNTVVDIKKLGLQMYFVYIQFRNIDIEKEKQIHEYLWKHKNVAWMIKCIGNFDVVLKVFVSDVVELDKIVKEMESRFEANFGSYSFDVITDERAIPFSFLYKHEENLETYHMKGEPEKPIKLSKTELSILKAIARNARKSNIDIGREIGTRRENVKYYLKKLESQKVILKFRPDAWPKKLGYNWYFIILKTSKMEPELKNILNHYLINHPNMTYIYNTIGSSDVQVEVRVKTRMKLNEILMELRGILKEVLKQQEVLNVLQELKYTYVPERVLEC